MSRFLKRKNVVPKPLVVPTLMKNAEDNVVDGTLHLISPVHTADHLFNTKKFVFTAMWGSAEKCKEFWQKIKPEDPKFRAMDGLRARPRWMERTIPLIIHGDDGRFTVKHDQKLLAFSII